MTDETIEIEDVRVYQIETIVQLGVTFYNAALNQTADPTMVALFVEDPNFNVTQIPTNQIVRTGIGAYYVNFLPTMAGLWTYKWQGTGNVVASSKDRRFLIQASDLLA